MVIMIDTTNSHSTNDNNNSVLGGRRTSSSSRRAAATRTARPSCYTSTSTSTSAITITITITIIISNTMDSQAFVLSAVPKVLQLINRLVDEGKRGGEQEDLYYFYDWW